MMSDAADFTVQRNFFAAKIAAASASAVSADKALAVALREFGETFRAYFSVAATDQLAQRQSLSSGQLIAMSYAFDAWWVFGSADRRFAIGFDSRLVTVAADFAICKRVTPPGDAAPTEVDRSIASSFARRLVSLGDKEGDKVTAAPLTAAGTSLEAALAPPVAEKWNVITIKARLPEDGGDFAILIGRPDACRTPTAEKPNSLLKPETFARVREISLTVQCIGGVFEAPLRRILAMKPGDVLPFDWKGNGAASLLLGQRMFALGTIGDNNGRRAIRL
ncbi:MAG: FliM/FliN family flagellar motor switch protein [Parvularculaceae bacterium]|nr:FliM/FliN family flagellar motor switch protein [Parvularculaceae bacterium]